MNNNIKEVRAQLAARIKDFLRLSEKGDLAVSNFLTPAEVCFSEEFLGSENIRNRTLFFGGYDDAQRKRLVILPPYAVEYGESAEESCYLMFKDLMSELAIPILLNGSGYKILSHRDYMGAALSLGIERDTLGDIVTVGDYSAIMFCTSTVSKLILSNLDKIGADSVKIKALDSLDGYDLKRKFSEISGTVASARLDCVVGELTGLSREKSQALIRTGLCELNYIAEERCDKQLDVPCEISVRGYGKYKVLSIGGLTKKGRLRLFAQKYI